MNIQEALNWAKKVLNENKVEEANSSAEFLLCQVLSKEKAYIYSHSDNILTPVQEIKYKKYIKRRAKHEPVWYITGKIEFLGLNFYVDQNVLIPRPETELLVEKITEYFRDGFEPPKVLDIGTGSGVLILSLANILTKKNESLREADGDAAISFFASDISLEALAVAKKNAKSLSYSKKIVIKQGDLFEPWQKQKFDLIVANLPYIPKNDVLQPDISNFEPHLALFGGDDGLEVIERFLKELPKHINRESKIFLEIGYQQGEKITKMVSNILPDAKVTIIGDYADIDRIVIIDT